MYVWVYSSSIRFINLQTVLLINYSGGGDISGEMFSPPAPFGWSSEGGHKTLIWFKVICNNLIHSSGKFVLPRLSHIIHVLVGVLSFLIVC